ncbi:MAG: Na/Pi cotransporter family protein, partial [Rhodobacterales bacterium]
MIILSFAVKLFGATMLLLFAVSMVSTGIERTYGASFRRLVTTKASVLGMTLTGVMLAMILQSSAAVTLLVAGFSGTSAIGFSAGMAIVLGGDLGSALLI